MQPTETLPVLREDDHGVIPHDQPADMLGMIARAAVDPSVSVEKLERLMALKERHDALVAKTAFDDAMALVQARVPRITKDGRVLNRDGSVKSRYAKYEDIDLALRPLMEEYGFSISFTAPDFKDGILWITANVRHKGGHTEPTRVPVALDLSMKSTTSGNPLRSPAQDMGSTISYGKRYAKCAAFDIVTVDEDDDAQGESKKPITDEQIAKIEDWIQQLGGTETVKQTVNNYLRRTFNVGRISDLNQGQVSTVLNALREKASKK